MDLQDTDGMGITFCDTDAKNLYYACTAVSFALQEYLRKLNFLNSDRAVYDNLSVSLNRIQLGTELFNVGHYLSCLLKHMLGK